MAQSKSIAHSASAPATRRDFLYIATAAVGAVGVAAALVPLLDQMEPDASTLAAGGPVDIDITKIGPGSRLSRAGATARFSSSIARRMRLRCCRKHRW